MSVASASRPNTGCCVDSDPFVQFLKNDVMQQATIYDGQTVTLCDFGFREQDAPQTHHKYSEKGTWNERYTTETRLHFVTEIFHTKKLYHRIREHLAARLGYLAALFKCLLQITDGELSFAQFEI